MTDSHLDISQLAARLSALEKTNRRWKMGSLLLFLALVATAFLTGPLSFAGRSSEKAAPKAVTAQEFILKDSQGHVRGRMMTTVKGNPSLQFYDSAGRLWWFAPPKVGAMPLASR